MLDLYAVGSRKNPSTNIREVTTNTNHAAPYCVAPELKQHIHSVFVSNYFVFRQKISQRVILITVVMSGSYFKVSSNF